MSVFILNDLNAAYKFNDLVISSLLPGLCCWILLRLLFYYFHHAIH